MNAEPEPSPRGATTKISAFTWLSLLVASVALTGSLWLSLRMGLKACPLCFYQRTFVMAVFGVLALGLLTSAGRASPLSLLSLPSAVGGLGVAAFHVYLERTGTLECPRGVFDLGTAPEQSLFALLLLTLFLSLDVLRGSQWGAAGALLLGMCFAVAAVLSSPPLPIPPSKPYEKPPDVCRPPFVEAGG